MAVGEQGPKEVQPQHQNWRKSQEGHMGPSDGCGERERAGRKISEKYLNGPQKRCFKGSAVTENDSFPKMHWTVLGNCEQRGPDGHIT